MRLRSRGLGRKELVMDFRRYDIRRDENEVLITGTITEPVTWDFSIRIEPDDFPGLIKVARSRAMISLFLLWLRELFGRRNKKEPSVVAPKTLAVDQGSSSRKGHAPAPQTSGRLVDRKRMLQEARRALAEQRQSSSAGGSPLSPSVSGSPLSKRWIAKRVGARPQTLGGSEAAAARAVATVRTTSAKPRPSETEPTPTLPTPSFGSVERPSDGWRVRRVGRVGGLAVRVRDAWRQDEASVRRSM